MQQVKKSRKSQSLLSKNKENHSTSGIAVNIRNSLRSNQHKRSQFIAECEAIAANRIAQKNEVSSDSGDFVSMDSLIVKLWNPISSAEETRSALNDIANATANNEQDTISGFSRNGGIAAIVSAMKRFEDNAGIQEFACHVLRNLAHDLEVLPQIAKANGIAAMVSAMEKHHDNPRLQAWSISAFVSISGSCSTKAQVISSGALKASLVAMRLYPTVTVIQKKGCDLFYNISLSSVHRPHLLQENPQDQLKAAAVAYPKYCAKNANAVLFRLQPCAA